MEKKRDFIGSGSDETADGGAADLEVISDALLTPASAAESLGSLLLAFSGPEKDHDRKEQKSQEDGEGGCHWIGFALVNRCRGLLGIASMPERGSDPPARALALVVVIRQRSESVGIAPPVRSR